jgi:hypothetical protein
MESKPEPTYGTSLPQDDKLSMEKIQALKEAVQKEVAPLILNDTRLSIGDGFFILKGKRPPNYDVIRARFPQAGRPGVIFAYHTTIYVPSGNDIPASLIAHEKVHLTRQLKVGADRWWQLYIGDPSFMYHEEVLAHAAEYKHIMSEAPSRQVRRAALKTVAKRLSGGLYGAGVSRAYAEAGILEAIERNLV